MTIGRWILLVAWITCLLTLLISHRGQSSSTMVGNIGPPEFDWAGRDRINLTSIEFRHGWPIPLVVRTEHANGWDVERVDWRIHWPGLVVYTPLLLVLSWATWMSWLTQKKQGPRRSS